MLPLLLAASLWQAASQAGDRPSALCDLTSLDCVQGQGAPVPVEKIADPFVKDVFWIGGSHAGDIYATSIAIFRCKGNCGEKNPLGPSPEARISLKTMSVLSVLATEWKLRRDGHDKTAKIVRVATVIFNVALMTNNTIHAIRGR